MATNLHAHVMILYIKFMKISHWLVGCLTTIATAWLVMKPQPILHDHPLVLVTLSLMSAAVPQSINTWVTLV